MVAALGAVFLFLHFAGRKCCFKLCRATGRIPSSSIGVHVAVVITQCVILFQLAVSLAQIRTACIRVTVLTPATPQEAALMTATLARVSAIRILTMTMVEHSLDHNAKLVRFINTSLTTDATLQRATNKVITLQCCSLKK